MNIKDLELRTGAHTEPEQGVCLMEAVAWFVGEEHTDHPECVCPVLGAYGRALNDRLPDALRQELKPLIPFVVGTAADGLAEERRWMAADAAVRVFAPMALRAAGREAHAVKLESLPNVTKENADEAARLCRAAHAAAVAVAVAAAVAAAAAHAYAAAAAHAYAAAAAHAYAAAAAAAYAAAATHRLSIDLYRRMVMLGREKRETLPLKRKLRETEFVA